MTENTFKYDIIIENIFSVKKIEFLESKKEILTEALSFHKLYGNADIILPTIKSLCDISELILYDK